MASIAIVDDDSEVVALIYKFLTHGHHRFLKMVGTTQYVVESLVAFRPDVMVVPLFRQRAALARPIGDWCMDVHGASMLEVVSGHPALLSVPIVVFSFGLLPEEVPPEVLARVRWAEYLIFPEGLQLLNPTISGLVGTALGNSDDARRLKASIDSLGPIAAQEQG